MSKAVKEKFYPVALTISGSDSGGGSGIAADLRTFNALGVFGACAVTAVAAGNPAAVRRIDPVPAAGVAAQIDAVMENIAVSCCKSGMLFSAEIVAAVARAVEKHHLKLICDPVIFSDRGSRLLDDEALTVLKDSLLPQAWWITPRVAEAELLLGTGISDRKEMISAAGELSRKYDCSVWLKGGFNGETNGADVIVRDGRVYLLTAPQPEMAPFASHGAGCTLSAVLTAALALEMPWKQAVCESRAFVYGSLAQCVPIGKKINAMYPPVEDSIQLVKLTEAE